jgi:hypothetical protein
MFMYIQSSYIAIRLIGGAVFRSVFMSELFSYM